MKIHEFQAKSIFTRYGIPVPREAVVDSPAQVDQALKTVGGERFVVKAQIHAGGRGKAGGIKLVRGREEVVQAVGEFIGAKLVSPQTGESGKVVHKVLLQEAVAIEREYYVAVTLDRSQARGVVIYSEVGGMDIEAVARKQPDKVLKRYFDIVSGLHPFEARDVAFGLEKDPGRARELASIVERMARIFLELDATLVEINPLAVTGDGRLTAVDAKIDFDDNSLFRHPDLAGLRDPLEEDPRESKARQFNLSYVGLTGSVGCMVNGAGLAMATMDVIKLAGGMPANFLDVGGGAKVDQVKAAFKIILEDARVKAILVNIFGGIMKCDVIAEGILEALRDRPLPVPLVVRLEGTRVKEGKDLLKRSGIPVIQADDLSQAASLAVRAAGKP